MFSWFKKDSKSKEDTDTTDTPVENFSHADDLITYFKSVTGITFEHQQAVVTTKLKTFCRHHRIYSFQECIERLQTDSLLMEQLINYLTTNESYFYREFAQIREIISTVKGLNHKVSILCAPCATGEEPYTIAIALLESGVSPEQFQILGIDINTEALQKAKERVYSERSVKNIPSEVREKYFTQTPKGYLLDERFLRYVEFKQVNVFDEAFIRLGKFDIVLSRNMLIYFDKETKMRVKSRLESMRKEDTIPVFFGHADLF